MENMESKQWNLLSAALECATLRTLFVHGPPGTGKSFGAYTIGLRGRPLFAVTLTEDTPAAELRGHYIPGADGRFAWHHGPGAQAFIDGGRLVVNEISHAAPDVQSLLYALGDSPDTARITLPTGETILPAPGFQLILTDNAGPEQLPAALRDRMDGTVKIETPNPVAILKFPEVLRSAIWTCATIGDESRRVSLRSWDAIGRLLNGGMLLEDAVRLALPENGQEVLDAFRIATTVGA